MIAGVLNAPTQQQGIPTSTFTNGDNIVGTGLNNTLNIASAGDSDVVGVNATVSGIQNAKVIASGTITFDGTGSQLWTGLTSLTTNSNNNSAQNITVTATTNVNATSTGSVGGPSNGDVIIKGGNNVTVSSVGARTVNVGSDGVNAVGNISVTASAIGVSDVGVQGGNNVSINVSGQTGGGGLFSAINVGQGPNGVAPTGTVNVFATLGGNGSQQQGDIRIKGGSTVSVTQNTSNVSQASAITYGAVEVIGTANTTAVTVSQILPVGPTIAAGTVTISDANAASPDPDTINSVTLSSYRNNSSVQSAALSTLNLSGTGGTLSVNNQIDGASQSRSTLALNLISLDAAALSLGAASGNSSYTTVNLNSSGAASTLGDIVSAGTTIANLNISGSASLTLGNVSGLKTDGTITSTSSGGVTLTTPLGNGQGFSGASSSGNDSFFVGATTRAINVGQGSNTVGINASAIGAGGSVSAGSGLTDRLVVSASNAAVATASAGAQANFADKISGFEALIFTGVTNQTVDLARLDNISDVTQAGGNGFTLNNFQSGGTLRYTGASTAVSVAVAGAAAGSSDVLNVSLSAPTTFAAGILGAPNVETVNISAVSEVGQQQQQAYTQTLNTGNSVLTINLQGSTPGGFTLTNSDTSVTSFNASGFTGLVTWTTGALAAASTIRGAAASANVINASAAIAPITYFGGNAGNDIRTGSANDIVNGGSANDIIRTGAGQDVINSGGSGALTDRITGGTQADLISISGSQNALIVQAIGDSGSNTANANQTTLIATGFDRITGTTNGVQLDLPVAVTTVNTNVQNLAGTDDAVNFVTGTFTNGIFTFNPNGSDTLATYDTNAGAGTAFESLVLSGFIVGGQTSINGNTITLSNI